MHLMGVKEEKGWVSSGWKLTYPASWEQICKGVSALYEFYGDVEILVDNQVVDIKDHSDIMNIPEGGRMVIRGFSKIIKAPVMITFMNQMKDVFVTVPETCNEFTNVTYEKFNHSMCQYLDSVELAMHRK